VKWSAPHFGQCRSASARWFSAETDATSRASSARSTVLPRGAAMNVLIESNRRRASDLGTCHV
jgi:hypothetical protein